MIRLTDIKTETRSISLMFGIDRWENHLDSVYVAGGGVAPGVVAIGVRKGECSDAVRPDGDQRRLRLRINL
jgi:hypothetical protein